MRREATTPGAATLLHRNPDPPPVSGDCGDWLTVVRPFLVEPLFQPAAVARLHAVASSLPGDCPGVLELRLAPGPGVVDLSLRFKEPAQARRLAERVSPPHLGDFLRRWSEPDGSFRCLHSVWLEFDLDREPQGLPIPTVCAKLLPGTEADWILDCLIPALHGKPLRDGQRQRVALCLREIPAPATLLYVFSLLSRDGDAVRLEISGLDPAGIAGYLSRVAPEALPWLGDAATLFADVERIHLSFDIGSEILPRIGIEGSFSHLPRREPRWRDLFDRLVARGLCAPEKRDAVLAWPGYDSFWTAPERWPATPRPAADFCVRSLSHVKVVCRPGSEPEAKVYLMFGPLDGSVGAASSPASRSASSA
jgi:hypothetical protein